VKQRHPAAVEATMRRTCAAAFCLERWAAVSVIPHWTEPDTDTRWLSDVRAAVLARAVALIGERPYDGVSGRGWRARELARRLDTRFTDHARLVAAVLAVETGMAPAKAMACVQGGPWWYGARRGRWRCATR